MIRYHLNRDNTKILIDASAPSVISGLKGAVGDKVDYLPLLEYRRKNKLRDPFYDFCVCPISFNTANKKQMLINLRELIDEEMIVIDQTRQNNLVLALRTAQATDMILNKDVTTNDDGIDALSLACFRISVNQNETKRYDFMQRY